MTTNVHWDKCSLMTMKKLFTHYRCSFQIRSRLHGRRLQAPSLKVDKEESESESEGCVGRVAEVEA